MADRMDPNDWPCRSRPKAEWCDHAGPGGFMGHTCAARPQLSKWTPTTDLLTLRRMGKLTEELGELQAVAARVVIQGIDEVDPGTGKANRQRLLDELADVQAQIGCTLLAFGLDQRYLQHRVAEKMRQMAEWEAMFRA